MQQPAAHGVGRHGLAPRGLLRINCSVTAGDQLMAVIVAEFFQRYPCVQLELTTETRLVDVVLEGCDAGVRLLGSVPADMVAVPIAESDLDFCVVGAPAYFADHPEPQTPADLTSHTCIRARRPGGGAYRWDIEAHADALAFERRVPCFWMTRVSCSKRP